MQSGGTNAVGTLYIEDNSASYGTYNLSVSGRLTASTEYIGYGCNPI